MWFLLLSYKFLKKELTNGTKMQKLLQIYQEAVDTSHYTNISNGFRAKLMIDESHAYFAMGDPNVSGAPLIALCESWAEHIGMTFADMTYPMIGQPSIGVLYITRLEETWNEEPNHIPIGLYHDLIDSGAEPISNNVFGTGSTVVNDNVSGFTNHQMFQCLNSSTTSINDFRTVLINNYLSSTTNSQTDVNNLFLSY